MTPQRLTAAVVAAVATVALVAAAAFTKVPFVRYSPGPTMDILGQQDGQPVVAVEGHKTYPPQGELRFTTVSVSSPAKPGRAKGLGLLDVVSAWLSRDQGVYPYEVVYPEDQTPEDSRTEGQVQMVASQDTAAAVALRELGYTFASGIEIASVQAGAPADGALEVRDFLVSIGGREIETPEDVTAAITGAEPGEALDFVLLRGDERLTVPVTPKPDEEGTPKVGIVLSPGYRLPFRVTVQVDQSIGGPSAGLMFSLAIYDTLTPGDLTGGGTVAGTGEIRDDGSAGPIGGIQQKIVGAREGGVQLFLVPAPNCDDSRGADDGDMRLARVTGLHQALSVVETWAADHDAPLPTCTNPDVDLPAPRDTSPEDTP